MRRTGRVFIMFLLMAVCMAGMYWFHWYKNKGMAAEKTYPNAYIESVSGGSIRALQGGNTYQWKLAGKIEDKDTKVLADVVVRNEKVVKITKKPEKIVGKLLTWEEGAVTIQNYGKVSVSTGAALYVTQGDCVSQGKWSDLAVGMEPDGWVVAGEEICGTFVKKQAVSNIRVLLKGTQKEYGRSRITVQGTKLYYTVQDGRIEPHKAGSKISVEPAQMKKRLVLYGEGGNEWKIDGGSYGYQGTMEITNRNQKLYLVNELPLQNYLYGVVPGEMSASSSLEALKAQAVCARSYSLQQMAGKRMAEYGAHVDDTVAFQVYGTQPRSAATDRAVNETKDQVLMYKGKLAATYFYSTSCGVSSTMKEVWNAAKDVSYLSGEIQGEKKTTTDLSGEKAFAAFLKEGTELVDSHSPWYRWKARIYGKELMDTLYEKLCDRYEQEPSNVQIRNKEGKFFSGRPEKLQEIQSISVIQRGRSGVVKCLEIVDKDQVIRVFSQYSVRAVLGNTSLQYERKDGSLAKGLTILPSGFFILEKENDSYVLTGGGYGHGVGMSQYGANCLAAKGKNASEILSYYFPGTQVVKEQNSDRQQ